MTAVFEHSLNTSFVKLLRGDLTHFKFKYSAGLNVDVNKFNNTPCRNGLHFCQLKDMPLHLHSTYDLIADVEIPSDAKVIHESYKSKADKIILKNIRSIKSHECWNDEKFCQEAFKLSNLATGYFSNEMNNKILLDYIYQIEEKTKTIRYVLDTKVWHVIYDYKGESREKIESHLSHLNARVVLGMLWADYNREVWRLIASIKLLPSVSS